MADGQAVGVVAAAPGPVQVDTRHGDKRSTHLQIPLHRVGKATQPPRRMNGCAGPRFGPRVNNGLLQQPPHKPLAYL